MHMVRTRSVVVGIVAMLVLAAGGVADAQMRPSSAEIVRATGRVEIMPKGQTAWTPAAVGARLVEGDQVRAMAGSAADLSLPDGSTILVAENTRFAVTKLDYDNANRDRDASFHVVAGKVRAQVSQAAVQLVRARQSNFNISTPNGVAAIRGTIVVIVFNPATQETQAFVFPSPGQAPGAARATFVNRNGQTVTVTGGNMVRQVGNQPPGAATPITNLPPAVQAAVQTAQNQTTLGANELHRHQRRGADRAGDSEPRQHRHRHRVPRPAARQQPGADQPAHGPVSRLRSRRQGQEGRGGGGGAWPRNVWPEPIAPVRASNLGGTRQSSARPPSASRSPATSRLV